MAGGCGAKSVQLPSRRTNKAANCPFLMAGKLMFTVASAGARPRLLTMCRMARVVVPAPSCANS